MAKSEKVYLLTDCCAWEKNKKDGTNFPHSIEVVDLENGAVHYIRSGAKIALIEGNMTEGRNQEDYNKM